MKTSRFALAFIAALSFGGFVALPAAAHPADEGGIKQSASDTWITTKVKSELAATKGLKSTNISVTTVQGVVTLTGVLPNQLAVKKAIAVTKSVKGVVKVDDDGLKSRD